MQERSTKLLKDLAGRFGLSFNAFGKDVYTGRGPRSGSLTLSDAWGNALEPAPVTPTNEDAAPFKLFSGSIKATYNGYNKRLGNVYANKDIVVAPGIIDRKSVV